MIALFQPVNNAYGFEIREFKIENGLMKNIKALPIEDYLGIIPELPIFKPKKHCKNRLEYLSQYKTTVHI